MTRQGISLLPMAAVLLTLATPVFAQSAEPVQEVDKSGTNPAKITRSFTIGTDFRALTNGKWFNNPTLKFNQPFNNDTMGVVLKLPAPSTNLLGGTRTGLGDISAKWNWVAYLDRQQGIVVSAEITAPTAAEDVFGSGKWVVAPGITYALFLSPEWILAPALVHSASFAGERNRADISRTDFDFYTVYKPKGQNWWLTSDITIGYDHLTRAKPASWKVALGTSIGKIGDSAVNLSIRPGIGIGRDRPADWTLEVALSVIGF
jgi:hypothetical protein